MTRNTKATAAAAALALLRDIECGVTRCIELGSLYTTHDENILREQIRQLRALIEETQ
jgi:hypothetical protein